MTFVYENKVVLGKVVQKAGRSLAQLPSLDVSAVVLYSGAVSRFPHHLQIVKGSGLKSVGFKHSAFRSQFQEPLFKLLPDSAHGQVKLLLPCNEMLGGEDQCFIHGLQNMTGQVVHSSYGLKCVAEKFYADTAAGIGGDQVDYVSSNPEITPCQGNVIPSVLHSHKLHEKQVTGYGITGLQTKTRVYEIHGITQTVQTAHRSNHDYILPAQKACGGPQTKSVQFLVKACVLFDEHVPGRKICFRLVVIVVADEILNSIFRKESGQLAEQLGGQGLVVTDHKDRQVHPLDDGCHGKGFSGTGDPQEGLPFIACPETACYALYGPRLVT